MNMISYIRDIILNFLMIKKWGIQKNILERSKSKEVIYLIIMMTCFIEYHVKIEFQLKRHFFLEIIIL
jgi:hypothetical protein